MRVMQVCLKVLVNIYLIYKTDIKTCFDHSIMISVMTVKRQTVCYRQSRDRQSRGRQCATDSQEEDSVLDSQETDSVLQTVKRQTVC